jgi:hypothetical protein
MKLKKIRGWSSALCLCVPLCGIAQAQETNQPADLDQRLIQMQEKFEQREREMEARFNQKIAAQDAEIEALKKQRTVTATNSPPAVVATVSTNTVTTEQFKNLSDKVDQVAEAEKKTLMSEFNPAIGLVGETIFSGNSKGSDQTGNDRPGGFDVWQRSIELNVTASVDPFAKGYAVINASADSATGETTLGVEEAAIQTTSLPWNLELKGGLFFAEFGQAGLHPRPRTAVCESSARTGSIHRRRIKDGWRTAQLAAAGCALREPDGRLRRPVWRYSEQPRHLPFAQQGQLFWTAFHVF